MGKGMEDGLSRVRRQPEPTLPRIAVSARPFGRMCDTSCWPNQIMVISRKHRYCFIEYPRSASYAIRKELIELYDGEHWLNKHSSHKQFMESLPTEYKNYFLFCSIRNPLTDVVSIYNVNRTNNSGRADPEFWNDAKWYVRLHEMRRARFFRGNANASFSKFFDELFHLPFVKIRVVSELKSAGYDAVIRVENLQEDFAMVLKRLGLEQLRSVSSVNVSTTEKSDLNDVYPPELRRKAVRVLGPMMEFMGYDFPADWNVKRVPYSSQLYFEFIKPFAVIFYNHLCHRYMR
jgi:hypothetical protein